MDDMLVLALLLSLTVSVCNACSCLPIRSIDEFCRYDVIFEGKPMAEYLERKIPLEYDSPFFDYLFQDNDWVYSVHINKIILFPENLKKQETIEVRSSTQDSLCGTRLYLDKDIVIFAHIDEKGEVRTGLCDPTTVWDMATDWEKERITVDIPQHCANKSSEISR